MRLKNNQSGFSAVEFILILVVVGIIGGTGWFVWHSKQAAYKTISDANKSQTVTKNSQQLINVDAQSARFQACIKAGNAFLSKDKKTITCTEVTKEPYVMLRAAALPPVKVAKVKFNKVAWGDLPVSLQQAITAEWPVGCTSDAQRPSARISTESPVFLREDKKAASVVVGCDSGSGYTFLLKEEGWKVIQRTQNGSGCSIDVQTGVSQIISDSTCYDENHIERQLVLE